MVWLYQTLYGVKSIAICRASTAVRIKAFSNLYEIHFWHILNGVNVACVVKCFIMPALVQMYDEPGL